MYCSNCNMKLTGNENYCSNCGNKINNEISSNSSMSTENIRSASIVLGIIGLCGVFFVVFAPVSLILSIVGFILAIKSNKNVKNTPGIIINAISLFLSFILTVILSLIIIFSYNTIKDIWNNSYHPYIYQENNYGDF